MKIDLNNEYCVSTDEFNFILRKKRVVGSKTSALKEAKPENIGKIRYTTIGYYPSLNALVHAMLINQVLTCHIDGLKELEIMITEFANSIAGQLRQLGIKKEESQDS